MLFRFRLALVSVLPFLLALPTGSYSSEEISHGDSPSSITFEEQKGSGVVAGESGPEPLTAANIIAKRRLRGGGSADDDYDTGEGEEQNNGQERHLGIHDFKIGLETCYYRYFPRNTDHTVTYCVEARREASDFPDTIRIDGVTAELESCWKDSDADLYEDSPGCNADPDCTKRLRTITTFGGYIPTVNWNRYKCY